MLIYAWWHHHFSSVLVIWKRKNVNFYNPAERRETNYSLRRACGRGLSKKYKPRTWNSARTEIIRPVIRTIGFYNIDSETLSFTVTFTVVILNFAVILNFIVGFSQFELTQEQYSEHGLKCFLHLQASDLHSDLEQSHPRLFVTASGTVLAQGGIMMAFNSEFLSFVHPNWNDIYVKIVFLFFII